MSGAKSLSFYNNSATVACSRISFIGAGRDESNPIIYRALHPSVWAFNNLARYQIWYEWIYSFRFEITIYSRRQNQNNRNPIQVNWR